MIFDSIKNRQLYENLNPNFKLAFDFIEKAIQNGADVGRYELDGANVYAMVQEYETNQSSKLFEAHRKYIDIQYILSGREYMECSNLRFCKTKCPTSTTWNFSPVTD